MKRTLRIVPPKVPFPFQQRESGPPRDLFPLEQRELDLPKDLFPLEQRELDLVWDTSRTPFPFQQRETGTSGVKIDVAKVVLPRLHARVDLNIRETHSHRGWG